MPGTLIIAGGAIEASERSIHTRFIDAAGGTGAKLAIVPTAGGGEHEENSKYIFEIWKKLGVKPENIIRLPIPGTDGPRMEGAEPVCDTAGITAMLDGATGVWFTGGDQFYITKEFCRADGSDTKALEITRRIYENGGVIGGCGAGAAIMSEVMICGGETGTALNAPISWGYDDLNEETGSMLRISKGLGYFPAGVIDQHWDARPRFFRLVEAVTVTRDRKSNMGFGVSEDTALIYDGATGKITVAGSGAVYIVDCRDTMRMGELGAYAYTGVKLGMINENSSFDTHNREYRFYLAGGECGGYRPGHGMVSGMVPSCPSFGGFIFQFVVNSKDDGQTQGDGKLFIRSFIAGEHNGKLYGQELRYQKTPDSRAYDFGNNKYSFCGVLMDTVPYKLEKM